METQSAMKDRTNIDETKLHQRLAALESENAALRRQVRDLTASKQRFEHALNYSAIALCHHDCDLRYTWIHNPHMGFSPQEVIGKTDWDILPAELADRMGAFKRRVLETGIGVRVEIPTSLDDPAAEVFDLVIEPLLDEAGHVAGLSCSGVNITELKRTETALRQSREDLSEAQAIARLGRYDYDVAGDVWKSSAVLDDIFGITPDYPRNAQSWVDLVAPDAKEEMRSYLNTLLTQYIPFDREYRIIRHCDRQERWVHGNGQLQIDAQGKPVKLFGTIQDITARKRIEIELSKSEERFRYAMDSSNDGLWDWNLADDSTYFSPAYYRMLGYEPNEFPMTGQNWERLLHPEDYPQAIAANQDCIENRCQNFAIEFRMKAKDGSWRWILGRGRAFVRDADGLARRMIGTHVDITESKQIVGKLRMALQEQQNFLSMASHELRTPMAIIKSASQLMGGYYPNDAKAQEKVSKINSAVRRMTDLVDALMVDDRLHSSMMHLAVSKVDLNEMLAEICEDAQNLSDECQISITGSQTVCVPADLALLRIVFCNLIENALKFTQNQPKIAIGLDHDQTTARIRIADNGPGIPLRDQDHIFEKYYRSTETNRVHGVGLGLYITKRIVELHGGSITVHSVPEQGASFTVELPMGKRT